MKTQHVVQLTGMIDNKPAKTHQADDVRIFQAKGINGGMSIDNTNDSSPVLITAKGTYPLSWNRAGYFEPDFDHVKVHVIIKEVVARVIYWA